MPDGMVVPQRDIGWCIEAAVRRVFPAQARDPDWLQVETSWRVATQRRDAMGRIFWPGSDLGRLLRERLSEAQNHRCCWCGARTNEANSDPRRTATFEHILPRVMGGSDHPDNLAVSCPPCNEARGARLGPPLRKAA